MVQQQSGLETITAAKVHQVRCGTHQRDDFINVLLENAQFRAGQVIFFRFTNSFKKAGAVLVIEVLTGQGLLRSRKTGEHVPPKAFSAQRWSSPNWLSPPAATHEMSLAKRRPMNCQRASGGKKFR